MSKTSDNGDRGFCIFIMFTLGVSITYLGLWTAYGFAAAMIFLGVAVLSAVPFMVVSLWITQIAKWWERMQDK